MVDPTKNLPISGSDAIQALGLDAADDHLQPADAADAAWFLPRNTTSLHPISAPENIELSTAAPDALADRVLIHLGA